MGRCWTSLLLVLLLPSMVGAQGVDWKPIAVNAGGQLWDVISTERFLSIREERIEAGKHGCVESNHHYWGSKGFTPEHPDTRKMWRDKLLIIGAMSGLQILVEKTSLRHNKIARWAVKGGGYYSGGFGAYTGIRNGLRCGF